MPQDPITTIEAAGQTDVGLLRTNNQDTFVIADLTANEWSDGTAAVSHSVGARGVLLAVSDGMGGGQAGEVASALTIESLRSTLEREQGDPRVESVGLAVEQANREVWTEAIKTGRSQMGATLTAVIVRNDVAHIASVGDTRAYIVRKNRIRRITKDQSYSEAMMEAGCTEEQVRSSPFRNVILQAVGVRKDVVVALGQIALRQNDLFLLCSDGLWDKVKDTEVFGVVTESPTLADACSGLVELAKRRGGDDNITVVIARVHGDHLPPPGDSETVTDTYEAVREFSPRDLQDDED